MTGTARPRGSTLAPLRASALSVDLVELADVTRKFAKCPNCGRFAQVKRNELAAHNTFAEQRCGNSRRPLINDLDDADWANFYDRTAQQIERSRRSRPQHLKPEPPSPTPLAHLSAPRFLHEGRVQGHDTVTLALLDRAAKTPKSR